MLLNELNVNGTTKGGQGIKKGVRKHNIEMELDSEELGELVTALKKHASDKLDKLHTHLSNLHTRGTQQS